MFTDANGAPDGIVGAMIDISERKELERRLEVLAATDFLTGVYNLRIHHDRVLMPLLKDWSIGELTGLTTAAAEMQDKIMALPAQIMERAENFERRVGIVPA